MSVLVPVLIGLLFLLRFGPSFLRRLIRKRLGDYRRDVNVVDESLPLTKPDPRKIAVLGGGVAGIVSALTLARRGLQVTLFEKNEYLGGKLGSWKVELTKGRDVFVSHGFHAFFPHYENLNRFLDSVAPEKGGLRKNFQSIGEYVILGKNGDVIRFTEADRTPVFNLLSLLRAGVFSLGDALKAPGRDLYGIFLEYDHDQTLRKYDHLSFAEFDRRAKVPPRLKLAFNTFARAFFADEDRLSFAELVKSFHFYYLSQDGGLVYNFPREDYEAAILEPIRQEFLAKGATLRLGTKAPVLTYSERETTPFRLGDESYDYLIIATDVVGTRQVLETSHGLPAPLLAQFSNLKAGQRYSVWRLWLDRDVQDDIPVFVITERKKVLDAVALYHRFEKETLNDFVSFGAKSVLELHSYAVPDELSEEEVKAAFLKELVEFFPELAGMNVLAESFQLRADFTAFHVGLYETRPEVTTSVPGLFCAGDWVKLPFPAMLLEAAAASGLSAANEVLRSEGLREELVTSVPLRGLMAGMPSPPARKVLE